VPKLKIEGMPPLDGDYELDIEIDTNYTNRELRIIKEETGIRAGEIRAALLAGDNDVLVAITLIMLRRAGKGEPADLRDIVWEAKPDAVTWDLSDVQEDESIPPVSEPEANSEDVTSLDPSGSDSDDTSDPPANGRNATGTPDWATGSTSDHATLAT